MKLTLEQVNIETALRAYLQSNYGLSLRNKVAVMDFTAGRGKNGLSVLVTINDADIPGEDDIGMASVATLIDNTKAEKPLSATDKRIAAQSDAKAGTVGALLNTAEADAKPKAESKAATVAVEEVPVAATIGSDAVTGTVVNTELNSDTSTAAVDVAAVAETEVPAVSTEDAVATEAVDPVKPAPKTSSGLFS